MEGPRTQAAAFRCSLPLPAASATHRGREVEWVKHLWEGVAHAWEGLEVCKARAPSVQLVQGIAALLCFAV